MLELLTPELVSQLGVGGLGMLMLGYFLLRQTKVFEALPAKIEASNGKVIGKLDAIVSSQADHERNQALFYSQVIRLVEENRELSGRLENIEVLLHVRQAHRKGKKDEKAKASEALHGLSQKAEEPSRKRKKSIITFTDEMLREAQEIIERRRAARVDDTFDGDSIAEAARIYKEQV